MRFFLVSSLLVCIALAACPQGNCGCSWASRATCGRDDGSLCFGVCCCPITGVRNTGGGGSSSRRNNIPPAVPSYNNDPMPEPRNFGPGSIVSDTVARPRTNTWGGGDEETPRAAVDTRSSVNLPAGPWEGSAKTTRYWDCCKGSCGWSNNVRNMARGPVKQCDASGRNAVGPNAMNVCAGGGDSSRGPAYVCNDQQPFVSSSGVLMGFAASNQGRCCGCFELEFTGGLPRGKSMIVQVVNEGGDLGKNHFDIQLPGGGVGIFNGCYGGRGQNGPSQHSFPASVWGATYGGVGRRSDCASLGVLRPGCEFRFDHIGDNPPARFRRVKCPAELTRISGCSRHDDPQ